MRKSIKKITRQGICTQKGTESVLDDQKEKNEITVKKRYKI